MLRRVSLLLALGACAHAAPVARAPIPAPPRVIVAAVAESDPTDVVPKPEAPLVTSCREVAHVGDSTSVGLMPRIEARYREVGVERFLPEISGARSMYETYRGRPNATTIVRRMRAEGYRGCWVMALGTNDPANTRGNLVVLRARIDAMMSLVGSAPALWMTSKTLKARGAYRNANMENWNEVLVAACKRHPNMRVYDWASEVMDSWFTSDGVHFNGAGNRERGARIAKALARAFPEDGAPPASCVVHSFE